MPNGRNPWPLIHSHDEVFLHVHFDEGHVVFGREPVVGQHVAVTQLVLPAHPQHLPQVPVLGDGTLAPGLLGFYLAIPHVFADDLERHRQVDAARVMQAVGDIHTLDRAVCAMVKVPGDDFVFVAVGFLLDGVVEDQQPVVRLDGADGRLDQRPQVAGGVVRPRQEPRDPAVAERVVQQQGQPRRGDQRERTDQIIAVQLQKRIFHGSRST